MLKLSTTKKCDKLYGSDSRSCCGGEGGTPSRTGGSAGFPKDPDGGGVAACTEDTDCGAALEFELADAMELISLSPEARSSDS